MISCNWICPTVTVKTNITTTIVISAIFLGLSAIFWQSYVRFAESCRDFGLSAAYYFCELFGIEYSFTPTVTEYSNVLQWEILLPSDWNGFTASAKEYFSLLIDGDNFSAYWAKVGDIMLIAAKVIAVILPCVIVLILVIYRMYRQGNIKHNQDTKPLKAFKWLAARTYQPLKRAVLCYREYLSEHKGVWVCWIILWVFHLNLASVVMGFFAYYFYFVLSFDVVGLYVQVCKLFIDLQVIFRHFPWWSMAYFIYVIQSSLIVANYSIRTDNTQISNGNFPLWLTDFFPKNKRTESRHAHILDFDVLRLGKKVLENNPKTGSFEFGVVAITEIGKERGNNLELKEVKKGAEDTNQKNDLFNSWLKMCRHSATVDNFPFIKVFTDEQRPESWGADARDLADIINIASCGDIRLALPLYAIEEMISEWVFNRFMRLYEDFRFRRGDNTLLVHILKSVTAWLWRRNLRIYNRFGYLILKIEKERGTMDGKTENKKYYLMNAKIYAKRFSTDCFSDYFNDMAKRSKTGLMDYIEYVTEKATVDELKMQNSYFINSLYGNAGNGSA